MTDTPIRVAIVDDDASIRRALARLLRAAGMESETFDGGEAFLQSLSDHRPDCLLLDSRMSHMTGEQVLEQLAAIHCDVPAVIITAHDDDGVRLHARFPTAIAFRPKPLDDTALLQDIRSAVASHRRSAT